MRYNLKSFSSLLVGGLLATSAAAELTKVPRGADLNSIAGREDVELAEFAKRANDRCALELRRRGLTPRGDTINVGMGSAKRGKADDTMKADSISICIGAAVVGKYDNDDKEKKEDSKFLTHLAAGFWSNTWTDFKSKVNSAKDKGLKSMKSTLVIIDMSSVDKDNEPWDQRRKDTQQKIHDTIESDLKSLTRSSPKIVTRSILDGMKMEIDKDGDIKVDED
ncbi:Uu.00g111920.m01.CDS01 [Anthostomella pinea]|uniref:Uu.00g111920.m01.CDS01 n=1 Tax=Anthostomella pinea TaxID=933095 RepID=A0AAI8VF55_9PEZI|nr:Uu.00g111920.m01.CDS01 [Anthostomella pinea]